MLTPPQPKVKRIDPDRGLLKEPAMLLTMVRDVAKNYVSHFGLVFRFTE